MPGIFMTDEKTIKRYFTASGILRYHRRRLLYLAAAHRDWYPVPVSFMDGA